MWHWVQSFAWIFIFVMVFGVFVLWGPALWPFISLHSAPYTHDVYGVYLESGHVFYGEIRSVGWHSLVLENVHSFQNVTVGETSTSNFQAQKDNPLTRPENWLVIERDTILFYEKLTPAAKIMSLIRGES